jgi:cytochrome b subunit of formate dehydrogenase
MKENKKLEDKNKIIRFTKFELIQHLLLFITLLMLSLTGLSLKYYDSAIGNFFIDLEGGFKNRGKIHTIFSIVLILLGIIHAFYVTFSDRGQEQIRLLKFRLKDFKDFFLSLRNSFGMSKEKPKFEKYSFSQKFQYWGVIVGCFFMILTGVILFLKKIEVGMLLPKWLWDITFIIHGAEGLIIFIVLLVWHLYNVHINPEYFPMQKTWLTGKISEKELEEKYPLEYERLKDKESKNL